MFVDKLLHAIEALLYPGQKTIEPGEFEAFLTEPTDLDTIPDRYRKDR